MSEFLSRRPPASALRDFLAAHPGFDVSRGRYDDGDPTEGLGLSSGDPSAEALVAEMAICRRLLKVLPTVDVEQALGLMERGVRSAVQLADVPWPRFVAELSDVFGGDVDRMSAVLSRARAIRGQVLLSYMRAAQTADPRLPRSLSFRKR
jgi:hypothetical protein